MEFIESSLFSRIREAYFSDVEYHRFQPHLLDDPMLATSSVVRAALERFAGAVKATVSAAVFVSSTTGSRRMTRSCY